MIPQKYFDKVKDYYHGDIKRTWKWFESVHSEFGMLSPLAAIKLGKGKQVTDFIDEVLKGKKLL